VCRQETAVHDFQAERARPERLPAGWVAGGQSESLAQGLDPLQATFESDLAVWLVWLQATRAAQADKGGMRRLELVCGTGWTAATLVTLAFPLAGVTALVLSVALLVLTLIVAYVVVNSEPSRPCRGGRAHASAESLSLGTSERTRLVRIINLSRVAARPLGARLLLNELDEALAYEPFASWSALSELREMVQAGCLQLIPFVSEPGRGES
jgi:hypothetical protein